MCAHPVLSLRPIPRCSLQPPLEAVGIDAEAAATYGADVVTADLLDANAERPSHDPFRLGVGTPGTCSHIANHLQGGSPCE